jgi:hypothetical protein
MRTIQPDGSIRYTSRGAPLPVGGTFSGNGYNLDTPSPVVSYVPKAVKNPTRYAGPQAVPQLTMPGMTTISLMHNTAPRRRAPSLGDVIAAEEKVKSERMTSLALLSVGAVLMVAAVWLGKSNE